MAAYAPFKYNPSEMPPENVEKTFVGREHLLERLLAAIKEQRGRETIQHYLLLGPRGIGKTTMLLMIQKRLAEDPELSGSWLCVRYREEEFYVHTLRDLLALAADSLHAESNISEAGELCEAAGAREDDEESLAVLLSGLRRISKAHNKRILLLVDNFDEVFPKRIGPESGQQAFRKLLSADSFIMVIGTSVQLFEDIAGYDEAFFNFFSPVYLENLSDEEVEELLKARADLYGHGEFLQVYRENKEKFRAIAFLTGGNPRLVLMLYDILSERRFLPVVEALRETVDRLTPLLKDVLGNMPAQQSKILDGLMRLGGVASPSEVAKVARLPLNAVTTQLGRLKEARFVSATGEGRGRPSTYHVCDRMFRTWYQMRYLRPARRRIEMFVEFVRAWFSVEERRKSLGQFHADFDMRLQAGEVVAAREIAFGMEYLAASFQDESERSKHLEEAADAYLRAGEFHEAAIVLAEVNANGTQPQPEYEAAGYYALAWKLREDRDFAKAVEACREVLKRDRNNPKTRMLLGHCLSCLKDHESALNELTSAIEIEDAPKELVSRALVIRGLVKLGRDDFEGAVADYTTATQIEDTSNEVVAKALLYRGIAKNELGDPKGAIEDWTAAIELEHAPKEEIAHALFIRGGTKSELDDVEGAIADYTAAIGLEDGDKTWGPRALANRGQIHQIFGRTSEAIGDFARCAQITPEANVLHRSFSSMLPLLVQTGRTSEIADWVNRLGELEPEGTQVERQLEGRIDIVTAVARECSLEVASDVLDMLLKSGSPGLRQRVEFLKPALDFARSGEESVLAKLPQEEREFARRIAAKVVPGPEKEGRV